MRTHGWRGDPPRTDEEARVRIIEATARCVDRYGPRKTGLTDVAEELGVTRTTIYRYFRNIEELLKATSLAAAEDFVDRLVAHVAPLDDPADILVEAISFTVERLPQEPYVGLLITTGRTAMMSAALLSPTTFGFVRTLLHRLPVDWPGRGYDDAALDGLAEFMLRLLQSFLPGSGGHPDSPGQDADPRPFLRRWFVPGFAAGSTSPVGDHRATTG
jgi:AcrR family transcriptional regulator